MYRHGILEMQVCEKMGRKVSANTTTSLTSESCRKSNAQNLAASLVFCCFAKNPADLNFTPPLSVFFFLFFREKTTRVTRNVSRFFEVRVFSNTTISITKRLKYFPFFREKEWPCKHKTYANSPNYSWLSSHWPFLDLTY